MLQTRTREQAEELERHRENRVYLPGVELPRELRVAHIEAGLARADFVFLGVPAAGLEEVIASLDEHFDWAIIDTPPFSFAEFRRAPPADMPEFLADELESWLKRTYLQIREMELRLLLSNLRGSLEDADPGQPRHEAPPPT